MAKNSFTKNLIKLYHKIVNILSDNNLLNSYNELSDSFKNNRHTLEYSTKSDTSKILFDTSLSALELYEVLHNANQFNFEFKDGSILLFECTIEGKSIIKQRITYIKPFNGYIRDDHETDTWELYQSSDETTVNLSFPILIRIDYNRNEKNADHPLSHLTLSNIKNCRIPIKANLSFDRFVEFILQQIFNIYDLSIPKINQEETIRTNEKNMIHLNWI